MKNRALKNVENNAETLIRIKDVVLSYGNEVIIDRVSLNIEKGSFLPFIGVNGAGKTTLLRGIVGLIKPVSGIIETPFADKPAGYVPQITTIDSIYPFSVKDILLMGAYPILKTRNKQDLHHSMEGWLKHFSLKGHEQKHFSELSGGMKQKTLIARALMSDADVLVMDEPSAGLDERSEIELFRLLNDLTLDHKKTVLAAVHGEDLVKEYASKYVHVERGNAELKEFNSPLSASSKKRRENCNG